MCRGATKEITVEEGVHEALGHFKGCSGTVSNEKLSGFLGTLTMMKGTRESVFALVAPKLCLGGEG